MTIMIMVIMVMTIIVLLTRPSVGSREIIAPEHIPLARVDDWRRDAGARVLHRDLDRHGLQIPIVFLTVAVSIS